MDSPYGGIFLYFIFFDDIPGYVQLYNVSYFDLHDKMSRVVPFLNTHRENVLKGEGDKSACCQRSDLLFYKPAMAFRQ